MRCKIGTNIVDATRPLFGIGVIQTWMRHPQLGTVARVKFASGIKLVTRANCRSANLPMPVAIEIRRAKATAEEKALAKQYGLTVRQYREAIQE